MGMQGSESSQVIQAFLSTRLVAGGYGDQFFGVTKNV
jgi:hypothetical protein